MRPFVIDTDAGSDDAVALVMALTDPTIRVEALTVVCGNVPLEQAVQNTLYVRELCGHAAPVHAGAAAPLRRELRTAQFVHGSDGLGDIGLLLEGRVPDPGGAAERLVELGAAHAGELVLVTLGPLTNVARALELEPKLAQQVARCIVMGGTGRGPGNITPVSEFNLWVDPEAAHEVFDSGLPIEMIGWDISIAHAVFSPAQAAELRALGGRLAEFCVDVQATLDKFQKTSLGLEGFDLPDAIAMAIAIDPSTTLEAESLRVDIALNDDLTRGQTVVDVFGVTGAQPNASVVRRADRERFLRMLRGALVDEAVHTEGP